MSRSDLDAVRTSLLAIPAAAVQPPDLPVATLLEEARAVRDFVASDEVRARFEKIGLKGSDLDRLSKAVGALEAAQSDWAEVRDREKGEAQRDLETRGYEKRTEILEACRWALRKDEAASETVANILEGEGVGDMIDDLERLAALIEEKAASFADDTTFDPKAHAADARALAAKIRSGFTKGGVARENQQALSLRDRAVSYLGEALATVRNAGRYAFRHDPVALGRFASAHERRMRRRGRD